MTNKEKTEKAWELVNGKHIETNDEIQLVRYAVRIARELAERDTPKRIKYENNGIPYCAVCERSYLRDVRGNQNRFCGYCGQRLDWRRKKND